MYVGTQLRAFFALTFFSQFFFVFGRGRVGRGRVGRGRVGRGRVHEPSIFFLSLKNKMNLIETPRDTWYVGKSIRKITAAINLTIRDKRRKLWPQGFSYATCHSKHKMYKGHVMHTFDTEDELTAFLLDHAIRPDEIKQS